MATFLTTLGTSSQIEQLIRGAHARLTIITPYLKLSPILFERLKEADRRGVQIHLVFGKNELQPEQTQKISELKRLRLYFLQNLHAKCYANERNVIIGSMNLYEFSERNNREMGVLLSAEDGEVTADARREIDSILAAATPQPLPGGIRATLKAMFGGAEPSAPQRAATSTAKGVCIRCKTGIGYHPFSPLCDSCYSSWAAWGNEDYPERNCHRCSKPAEVTKAKPLCPACFREDPFTRTWSAFG
jgi:hypothetical protein